MLIDAQLHSLISNIPPEKPESPFFLQTILNDHCFLRQTAASTDLTATIYSINGKIFPKHYFTLSNDFLLQSNTVAWQSTA